MIVASVEKIVATLLIVRGFGKEPKDKAAWTTVYHTEHDSPDQLIIVRGTGGLNFGRTREDNEHQEKPGVQIVVRAKDADTANKMIKEIAEDLGKVSMVTIQVDIGGGTLENVLVHTISRTSSIMPLRQDEKNVRQRYTLNAIVTYSEL